MTETFDNLGNKVISSNEMDGVRIDYDSGWILIRRSGTSPYLRISGESKIDKDHSIKIIKLAVEKMKKLEII